MNNFFVKNLVQLTNNLFDIFDIYYFLLSALAYIFASTIYITVFVYLYIYITSIESNTRGSPSLSASGAAITAPRINLCSDVGLSHSLVLN